MSRYATTLLFVFLIISTMTRFAMAESILEYHQRQCAAGKESSCKRAEIMEEADKYAKRTEELGDRFAASINRADYETENKPELEKAYLAVIEDFFTAESDKGITQAVSDEILSLCAYHYHDYWLNQKLIWPTNEAGNPDWSTIYYFIIDHYYGYCLRSVAGESSS